MKSFVLKTSVAALSLFSLLAQAADNVANTAPSMPSRSPASELPPVVRGEYAKTQQELQVELIQAKRRLQELEGQKRLAINQAHAAAQVDQTAIKVFQDYQTLLVARHTDDRDDFQPGSELTPVEVENLNKLFYGYLQFVPFRSRVSAGQAKKQIEWGISRLEDQTKTHANPSDANNSDFQIIAKQTRDAENALKRIQVTAEKLNFKLNPNMNSVAASAPAPAQEAAGRAPASVVVGTPFTKKP